MPTGAVFRSDVRSHIGMTDSVDSSCGAGLGNVTLTVVASGAANVACANTAPPVTLFCGSEAHFKLSTTDCASNSLPFWYLTPARIVNM